MQTRNTINTIYVGVTPYHISIQIFAATNGYKNIEVLLILALHG